MIAGAATAARRVLLAPGTPSAHAPPPAHTRKFCSQGIIVRRPTPTPPRRPTVEIEPSRQWLKLPPPLATTCAGVDLRAGDHPSTGTGLQRWRTGNAATAGGNAGNRMCEVRHFSTGKLDVDNMPLGSMTSTMIQDAKNEISTRTAARTIDSTDAADRLLRRLIDERLAGNEGVTLLLEPLKSVIDSYRILSEGSGVAAGGRVDATFAEKADSILRCIEDASVEIDDITIEPDSKSYSMVIDAYAKVGDADKAEAVLLRLDPGGSASRHKQECRPNRIMYTAVLDAWAKSRAKGAAQRAESILEHMEKQHSNGLEDVRPDTYSYNAVINAWAKSGEKGNAKRAQLILEHMMKLHENGRDDICPDTISFSSVIDAWAKSGEKESAHHAEALLQRMEDLHKQGNSNVRPDTQSYNTVLDAWAKSSEKGNAKRAQLILEHMIKLHENGRDDACPNTISFSSVIDAWAKSGEKGAAHRAEALLQRMQDLHQQGNPDVRPDTLSYTACIDAYAKSSEPGSYQKAERLFKQMLHLEGNGDAGIKLDIFTYTTFLNALAWSSVPDKATKARAVLLDMDKKAKEGISSVSPDSHTYNAVLRACARTSGNRDAKRRALRVAVETLAMLRDCEGVQPSPHSYNEFFSACGKCSSGEEYRKLVEKVFTLCCQDGVLNDIILNNLRRSAPSNVFNKLVGSDASSSSSVTINNLPPEWSRNIRDVQRTRQRRRR